MDKPPATLFAQAGVSYPPQRLTLLALKEENRLEIFACRPISAIKVRHLLPHPRCRVGWPDLNCRKVTKQVPEGFIASSCSTLQQQLPPFAARQLSQPG